MSKPVCPLNRPFVTPADEENPDQTRMWVKLGVSIFNFYIRHYRCGCKRMSCTCGRMCPGMYVYHGVYVKPEDSFSFLLLWNPGIQLGHRFAWQVHLPTGHLSDPRGSCPKRPPACDPTLWKSLSVGMDFGEMHTGDVVTIGGRGGGRSYRECRIWMSR